MNDDLSHEDTDNDSPPHHREGLKRRDAGLFVNVDRLPGRRIMTDLGLSRTLLVSIGLLLAVPAHGAQVKGVWIKNVGDWAKREAICSRALAKEKNEVVVYERDVFIVRDNEIIGASAKCKIKARKDDENLIRLLIECPSEIAENQLTFRVEGPDEMTRIFPGWTQMNVKYFRCPEVSMP